MREFLTMMGEIFLIVCIQSIMEAFVLDKNNSLMQRLLSIACYLGSLFIVLQFTFQSLIGELARIFRSFL